MKNSIIKRTSAGLMLALFVITALFVWSNIFLTKQGSPLDVGTLRADDQFTRSAAYAATVFSGTEAAYATIRFPNGIKSQEDIELVNTLHEKLARRLEPYGILLRSIANTPCFRDRNDTLYSDNCGDMGSDIFSRAGLFSFDKWSGIIKSDEGVYPALIGRAFDYAQIYFMPPEKMGEIEFARHIIEAVQGKRFSFAGKFVAKDISPEDPQVMLSGWIIIRWLIGGALNSDMLTAIPVGILLSGMLFFLAFRSVSRSLIAMLGVVALSIVWTRGGIGLLDLVGGDTFVLRERVYALLAYTNCIVQGISFPIRLYASYDYVADKYPGMEKNEIWRRAKKRINFILNLVAVIAVFGFLSLYVFEVASIRELGIVSALGVVNVVALSRVFLPAIDMLFGAARDMRHTVFDNAGMIFLFPVRAVEKILLALPQARQHMLIAILFAVLGAVSFAMWDSGKLIVGTKSRDYIAGTMPDKAAAFHNENGRAGMDAYNVFIEPALPDADDEKPVRNPKFLREALRFAEDARGLPHARETFSVLRTIRHIAKQSLPRKAFPETRRESNAVFILMEERVSQDILKEDYNNRGLRVAITTTAETTREFTEIRDAVLHLSKQYPDLRVSPFGKLPTYAGVDTEILLGKPKNMLAGQLTVALFCIIAAWFVLKKTSFPFFPFGSRAYGAIKIGLALSAPFAFAVLAVLVLMMAFGIPLDTATAAIGPITINASIDFAAYFGFFMVAELIKRRDEALAQHNTFAREGGTVTLDALANAAVFLPLVFLGSFVPVERLGWMMVLMLSLAWTGVVLFLPSLLRRSVPRGK